MSFITGFIIVLTIVVAAFIACFVIVLRNHSNTSIELFQREKIHDSVLKTIIKRKRAWAANVIIWTVIDYLLVALPFICSVIIVFFPSNEKSTDKALSVTSAACVVFSFIFNPKKQIACYRRCFVIMDYKLNQYAIICLKGSSDRITDCEYLLIETLHRCESLISGTVDTSWSINTFDNYINNTKLSDEKKK